MKKPEELLTEINKSVFARALVISVAAHAVLLCVTSVSLFRDWTKYGIHSPSYINAEKTRERNEAEEARRREEAEKKAAAEAAKAAADKAAAATNTAAKVEKKVNPEPEDKKEMTPPEIEPLPPKDSFEYGEDLTLD